MAYYFHLPPFNILTMSQQTAVNEPNALALSGGPGTGKSLVSLYRHIANYDPESDKEKKKKSVLLTYTTTLCRYLKYCCAQKDQQAASRVFTASPDINTGCPRSLEHFRDCEEIIIDEAQDLGAAYYDCLPKIPVSYGADNAQILYPLKSSTLEELESRYPGNVSHILDRNFRSTYCIMDFARTAFPEAVIPQALMDDLKNERMGVKPIFVVTDGIPTRFIDGERRRDEAAWETRKEKIKKIIKEFREPGHNIAILAPHKSQVDDLHTSLDELGIGHSFYYNDEDRFPNGCPKIDNVHVTTFKSAKGLEFDTVIIDAFDSMDYFRSKRLATWNEYYVGVTRAKSNLYILSNYRPKPIYNQVANIYEND